MKSALLFFVVLSTTNYAFSQMISSKTTKSIIRINLQSLGLSDTLHIDTTKQNVVLFENPLKGVGKKVEIKLVQGGAGKELFPNQEYEIIYTRDDSQILYLIEVFDSIKTVVKKKIDSTRLELKDSSNKRFYRSILKDDKDALIELIIGNGYTYVSQSDFSDSTNVVEWKQVRVKNSKIILLPETSANADKNDLAKNKFVEVLNAKSEKKVVGAFVLKNSNIKIHSFQGKKVENFLAPNGKLDSLDFGVKRIKKVIFYIDEGVIGKRLLQVEMTDGSIYSNLSQPISLPTYFKLTKEQLRIKSKKEEYIYLGDVLDFIQFGKFSYPEDAVVVLDSEKRTDTIYSGTNINNYIDVAVYSDMLGLISDKPNGIIQTELSLNLRANTHNVRNKDLTFHSFVKPYISFSKFDSKVRSIDSTDIKTNKDTIDRTTMVQKSYFQAGLLVNLFKLGIGVNQKVFVNFGSEVNLTNADSIYKSDLIFFNYYPEVVYNLTNNKNLGMEASVKWLFQGLSGSSPFKNRERVTFFKPQLTLYYSPFEKPRSRLYARFNYFDNLMDGSKNFLQLQVGFKTDLNVLGK